MAKYTVEDEDILVDGEPIAQVELLIGELNECRLKDLIAAANYGVTKQSSRVHVNEPVDVSTEILENGTDDERAASFLAHHHVPIVSPDIGSELVKIIHRMNTVGKVFPLSPTLQTYQLALKIVVQFAVKHQHAFCVKMEGLLAE